ncbi:hypothetical protein BDK92_6277 [Micromonospora pisi]|uniref:Uncharacterized protein n=2 Tax=Micromonospora pisi TaxID=589240 RepID=A0A495JSM2_9ACTN|nr:hypothetical protein BDK92_6277 [Micromonospora pisi]
MYEGDPEVIKGVLAEAPLVIRLVMPIIGRRAYAAHAKRIHGTATPQRFSTPRSLSQPAPGPAVDSATPGPPPAAAMSYKDPQAGERDSRPVVSGVQCD